MLACMLRSEHGPDLIVEDIDLSLRRDGYALVKNLRSLAEYRGHAARLGHTVGEEMIAIRPGAHAYVAKPGPVPLHTDQPQIEVVCWLCIEQDEKDGASLLLDAAPVVRAQPDWRIELLRSVYLACPPVAGGAPVLRFPVLRPGVPLERVFCSPWLQSLTDHQKRQQALDDFRRSLSSAARTSAVEVRLAPGDALFVDNQRVLHGRGAITERSRRRLHRLWIIRHETAAEE